MPAEINPGGPRVLHCDYRADCPALRSGPFRTGPSFDEKRGTTVSSQTSPESDERESPLLKALHETRCDWSCDHAKTAQCCLGKYASRFHERKHRVASRRPRKPHRTSGSIEPRPDEENDPDLCFDPASKWESHSFLSNDAIRVEPELRDNVLPSSSRSSKRYVFPVRPCRTLGPRCSCRSSSKAPTNVDDGGNDGGDHEDHCPIKRRIFRASLNPYGPSVLSHEVLPRRRYRKSLFSSHSNTCQDECSHTESKYSHSENTEIVETSGSSSTRSYVSCTFGELRRVDSDATCQPELRPSISLGYPHERPCESRSVWKNIPSNSVKSDIRTPRSGGPVDGSSRTGGSAKIASYLQLVFLLFLLMFGHSGLLNSSVHPSNARFGTGLSVLMLGTVFGGVRAAPIDLVGDAAVRAERSANLSHITGASRKIQMYVKNRHLQILPDGTVNGSNDDMSDYTILQRTSVSRGQLKIRGVATCLYLCMDSCGLLYGSREYTEDCVFNETLEQHNYNTYSSARWSTARKTLYLGFSRHGQPRRVQVKGHNLGRLSAYARVLTQGVPIDRVEALQRRMLGAQHNIRHHHGSQQAICPPPPPQERDGRDRFRCRKRKKRKKKKRRCREGETPGPQCEVPEDSYYESGSAEGTPQSKRSCEGAASDEACRREALNAPSKKRKSRIEEENGETTAISERSSKGNKKGPNNGKKSPSTKKPNNKKPNGMNGGKKKGPMAKKNPSQQGARKKGPGRVTRTTGLAGSGSVTSPLSWYPGASTTPSPRVVPSPRKKTRTPPPRNNVTGPSAKPGNRQRGRTGKMLNRRKGSAATTSNPLMLPGIRVDAELQPTDPMPSTSTFPTSLPEESHTFQFFLQDTLEPRSNILMIDDDSSTLETDSTTEMTSVQTNDYLYSTPIILRLAQTFRPSEDLVTRPTQPEIDDTTGFPSERLAIRI